MFIKHLFIAYFLIFIFFILLFLFFFYFFFYFNIFFFFQQVQKKFFFFLIFVSFGIRQASFNALFTNNFKVKEYNFFSYFVYIFTTHLKCISYLDIHTLYIRYYIYLYSTIIYQYFTYHIIYIISVYEYIHISIFFFLKSINKCV